MSSGGGKKETVTQSAQSGPPDWAVPYFQSALGQAGNIANQPYTPYGGPRVAGFTWDQQRGMDMTSWLAEHPEEAGVESANTFLKSTINGQQNNPYAGQNPYLDQMIGKAQTDVTDAYSRSTVPNMLSQFNGSGAYGGTQMMDALSQSQRNLGDSLGNVSTQLRSEDYNRQTGLAEADLNRRMQAAGMAPELDQARYNGANQHKLQGLQQQDWLQSLLDTDYGDFQEERDWGANRLGVLTNALGAIQGGTSQSSSTQANPNYRSGAQNAASYAAILASLYG